MSLLEVSSKLDGKRKTANGFLAKCPSRDDKNQSLSIKKAGGKVLLNCFAGCDNQTIVSELGLQMKDLFESSNGFHGQDFKQKKAVRRVIETYDYTDENGKLLYQAVRYEPKGFAQKRPGRQRRLCLESAKHPADTLPIDGSFGFPFNLSGRRRKRCRDSAAV